MSATEETAQAFVDTCILLNFVQREWERPRTVKLIENSEVGIVASEKVWQEFSAAVDRREDLYRDMVDYLGVGETAVEDYEPDEGSDNDLSHIRRIQQELATHDDPDGVLTRLRTYIRAANRRVEHIETLLKGNVVDPLPPFELKLAIDRIINHPDDTKVISDASAWTANGGSGILVTMDKDDMFDNTEEIREVIIDKQDPEWIINIIPPEDAPPS